MRKWQHTTIAAAVATAVIFSSAPSFADSKQAYQNEFIEILEIGPALLKSCGAGVGKVVGNHIGLYLLGVHAGGRCETCPV